MAYVRGGQVVQGGPTGLKSLLAFVAVLWSAIVVFFKTIFNPAAAHDYAAKSRRGGYGGGGGGGGRPGGGGGSGPRGPRITGLSDLRDASGNVACSAGG